MATCSHKQGMMKPSGGFFPWRTGNRGGKSLRCDGQYEASKYFAHKNTENWFLDKVFFFFFLTWLQISCVKIQETLQVSTETEGMVCEQEIHSDGDSLFLIQELWSSVSTGQIISGMLSLVLQAGIGSLALGKQKFNVQEESLRCCVLVCLPFLVIQFP